MVQEASADKMDSLLRPAYANSSGNAIDVIVNTFDL